MRSATACSLLHSVGDPHINYFGSMNITPRFAPSASVL